MELEKGAHCKYQIRYHIVWKVKYSRKLLFGDRIRFLKETFEQIGIRYDYTVDAVGIDDNHIHLFAGAHPAIPPAKLIQTVKSISARKMFEEYPEIKKFLWGGAIWAVGYYVRTVSDGPIDSVVKEYVDKQNINKKDKKKAPYQLKLVP